MRERRIDRREASRLVRVPLVAPSASPAAVAIAGGRLVRCTIKSVEHDYLLCHPVGTPSTKRIRVAKPYEFQRKPWDGLKVNGLHYQFIQHPDRWTITKLNSSGTLTDEKLTRVLVPPYSSSSPNARDREILAASGIEGKTGVKPETINEFLTVAFASVGWTVLPNTGWSIPGGAAIHTAGNGGKVLLTDALITGTQYQVTFTVSSYVSGQVQVVVGSELGTARSSNGSFSQVITCNGGLDLGFLASIDFQGSITTVSCQVRVPGETPWQDLNLAGRQFVDVLS